MQYIIIRVIKSTQIKLMIANTNTENTVFLLSDFMLCKCTCTVPTFNSCTKCMGGPGIIHDRTPSFVGIYA